MKIDAFMTEPARLREVLGPKLAPSHKGDLTGVCLREVLEAPIPVAA